MIIFATWQPSIKFHDLQVAQVKLQNVLSAHACRMLEYGDLLKDKFVHIAL